MDIEILETKTVYVAWSNTDCTEGRGIQYPKAVCNMKATAIRLGKRGSVQGSDCPVTEDIAIKLRTGWLIPGRPVSASAEDIEAQRNADIHEEVLNRALKMGLSGEDIEILRRK